MSPNAEMPRRPFKQMGWLPEQLNTKKLINLRQMLEITAHEYASIGSGIQAIQDHIGVDEGIDGVVPETLYASLQRELAMILGSARRLNLAVSVNLANQFYEAGKSTRPTYRKVQDDLRCLRTAFYAELETRLFFFVSYERSEYYCEGGPFDPLGKKMEAFAPVITAFPSAEEDIWEAGNCLALGRFTASVFHLMRIMEVGLKAISKALGISYTANWGASIAEIEKRATDDFFREAVLYLRSVKNVWRNPTMHIERTYSADTSERIMQAVQVFMGHLATKLTDQTR